jgi:two-component system phosphate regulon sensor histidine kinase PhoR
VFTQLSYLYQLSNWMDDPQSAKLPDGWGEWTNIFSRLYRMRREDEKPDRADRMAGALPPGHASAAGRRGHHGRCAVPRWCNPAAEQHLGLSNERDKACA